MEEPREELPEAGAGDEARAVEKPLEELPEAGAGAEAPAVEEPLEELPEAGAGVDVPAVEEPLEELPEPSRIEWACADKFPEPPNRSTVFIISSGPRHFSTLKDFAIHCLTQNGCFGFLVCCSM